MHSLHDFNNTPQHMTVDDPSPEGAKAHRANFLPHSPNSYYLKPHTAYTTATTCNNLTHFYHACLFSLVKSTLIKAINRGYFKGFLGLVSARVSRHVTINNETKKGHMDQTRQGQCTTSRRYPSITLINTIDNNKDDVPIMPIDNEFSNLVYMTLIDTTGKIYSDQTGHFPITSNRSNAYLVIFYVYDANFIASVSIKIGQKKNSSMHTNSRTTILPTGVSHYTSTKWITKHHTMLKPSLPPKTPASNTHRLTCIAPILLNEQSACGRIISQQDKPAYPNLFLLQIGVFSQINATTPSTCSNHVDKILYFQPSKQWKDHFCSTPLP